MFIRILGRSFLIALGKASVAMTQAAVDRLGERIARGVCVCKAIPDPLPQWEKIDLVQGAHPIPDERSQAAAEKVSDCLKGLEPEDLVLVLISGGASALVSSPIEGISLDDLKETYRLLLRSGATIDEVNAVRKHLEFLKGGGLIRAARPARMEALLLSDVIGDDMSVIASGPTVADPTTFKEVQEYLKKYDLLEQIPAAVLEKIMRGAAGGLAETVKPGDDILQRVHNRIVGSNTLSIDAALNEAKQLGVRGACVSEQMVGEARLAAQWFLEQSAKAAVLSSEPVMVIAGEKPP